MFKMSMRKCTSLTGSCLCLDREADMDLGTKVPPMGKLGKVRDLRQPALQTRRALSKAVCVVLIWRSFLRMQMS